MGMHADVALLHAEIAYTLAWNKISEVTADNCNFSMWEGKREMDMLDCCVWNTLCRNIGLLDYAAIGSHCCMSSCDALWCS